MLMIRLQRLGKTKRPAYRLIVSDKHKDTQAGSLEILGQYDPVQKNKVINFKIDRLQYWLSVGAQPSITVHNLLVNLGLLKDKKAGVVHFTKKRAGKMAKAKADDVAKAEKAKADAEAAVEKAKADEKAKLEAEAAAKAEPTPEVASEVVPETPTESAE